MRVLFGVAAVLALSGCVSAERAKEQPVFFTEVMAGTPEGVANCLYSKLLREVMPLAYSAPTLERQSPTSYAVMRWPWTRQGVEGTFLVSQQGDMVSVEYRSYLPLARGGLSKINRKIALECAGQT